VANDDPNVFIMRLMPITKMLCTTLAELERKSIVHCDIKPDNIVGCYSPSKWWLIDFDCAKFVPHIGASVDVNRDKFFLTHAYAAPEAAGLFCGRDKTAKIGTKFDVWCLGASIVTKLCRATLPEVCGVNTAHLGWESRWGQFLINPANQRVLVSSVTARISELIPTGQNDALKFIQACLVFDPRKRMAPSELLKLPFLRLRDVTSEAVRVLRRVDTKMNILDVKVDGLGKKVDVHAKVSTHPHTPPLPLRAEAHFHCLTTSTMISIG
jgi:serine/threonine protein kinase